MSSRRPYMPTSQRSSLDRIGDPVERAIEALRLEWRAGFNGRAVRETAIPAVKKLAGLAAAGQAHSELADIVLGLDRYSSLTTDERKKTLADIAGRLESLKPLLRVPTGELAQIGKLNEAVAPGRARSTIAQVESDAPPTPRVTRPPAPIRPIDPSAPVTALPEVAESRGKLLEKLGITTVEDLVRYAPRKHIDYSTTIRIGEAMLLRSGEDVTVRGTLISVDTIRGRKTPRVEAKLDDGSGWIKLVWFNNFIGRTLHEGDQIAVSGAIESGYGRPTITNPEWEYVNRPGLSTGRMVPVYPLTQGLTQKGMRKLTRYALDATKTTLHDFLPVDLLAQENLPPLHQAYEWLHFPPHEPALERAKNRLSFSEMLLLHLGLTRRKRARESGNAFAFRVDQPEVERFEASLPFRFTDAQRRVVGEITRDLQHDFPMARLLQGDVGSGKTAVAATACWLAVKNGLQAAVLAPTEILAEQHAVNFARLFEGLSEAERPQLALLTGSTKTKARRELLAELVHGEINVLIGTHAVIQPDVKFHNLALSVIDEQHRFGVRQRESLPTKASESRVLDADVSQPHVLSMTATPIPRTLSAVVHGDLEVSIIDELPPGRMPIDTRLYLGDDRELAYDLIRQEVAKGRQAFVICPLVEESDLIDAKAAVAEAERLQSDVFPELRIQVLHGRMAGKEKDRIMTGFSDREWDILVSTSVIEVGIDIPNSTVMVIEGSDRFGLAQLHQFRGRVGRGGAQSYCLLLSEDPSNQASKRLHLMVETNNGFVLAEKDLEFRGPGDFLGTRQSGLPELPFLTEHFDSQLFDRARASAEQILETDPDFKRTDHAALRERFQAFWANRGGMQTA
jgi:ATP-dependent DNA helicase RecG